MADTAKVIDVLAYPPAQPDKAAGPALTDPPEILDVIAYTIKQSAKVVARSETRVKRAIREKELTARKDGRATIIERTELRRWVASLRTIGRDPVQEPAQETAHVALPSIARQPVPEAALVTAMDRAPNLSIRDGPPISRSRTNPRSARPKTEAKS